ncbi:MAG: cobalamin-dependent protein [Planctomycetota bacterium]
MASRRNALQERFFNALISGDRPEARAVVDELIDAGCSAEEIVSRMFWPIAEQVDTMHRGDQLSDACFHYATRLLRMLVDQMQLRLARQDARGEVVIVISGAGELEELAGQMTSDLLEAAGFEVRYIGGGVANDEIVDQLGSLGADRLVVFGAVASTVPQTRLLIDRLHDTGVCPKLQITVGGGVFNRAEGLAEEIGADLWAEEPEHIVEAMIEEATRRMTPDQRTVGRRRRSGGSGRARDAA